MTFTIADELENLRAQIERSSGLIARCTLDSAQVKPEPGQVHVWLQPPSVEWDMWDEWETEYTAMLVAGTVSTQLDAALLMLRALTDMQTAGVNVRDAEPSGWNRDGQLVAAYRVTLTTNNTTNTKEA